MMKRVLVLALLTVTSCVAPEGPAPVTNPGEGGVRPTTPPRTRPAPAPRPSGDTCGARPLQYLVGRPRTEIPVPVDLTRRRVTCTTCPVTMDFNPERLNILYDQESGIVRQVKCG